MKKFCITAIMSLIILSLFVGCGNSTSSKSSKLSDAQIQAIAKSMNEEINFMGKLNDKYNLQYSGFRIETDNYNRFIVSMHYQYEDSNRNYQSGNVIVYFRWNPKTEEYLYKKTNISFPVEGNAILTEEKLINHIKSKEDFGWGTNPDSLSADGTSETDISATADDESTSVENNIQSSAEWNEMPLHKCIYCGGIARLTSGAWCCDDCYAVYGEEDFAEKVSFDAFKEGTWWDTYSQRCNMTINVIDNETVAIEINWSSSASENTQWIITGKWDSYWSLLRYEKGIKQDTLTTADGHTDTNVSYDDGSGFFYFNSGYLYWVDYKESAGFDCVFEFPNF